MSLFDWYQPAPQLTCPQCGTPLTTWQGKDGPCGLFVWREGVRHPVDQLIDDEEVRLPPEELSRFTLPSSFEIYSYDCPNHQPIDAVCETEDGVWSSTQVQPFTPKYSSRRWRMEELSTYLEHAFERNFVQGQYNNTTRDLYKILQGALRLGADALVLTPAHLTLAKDGAPIRQIDLTRYEQAWGSFRKGMQVILKHDERVRQHIRLAEERPEVIEYTILPDVSP